MNTQQTLMIWDLFVRIFHWSLVILVGLAFLTGDENSRPHIYAGYAILLLIALRLIWGFVGSKHARFSSFITSPGAAIEYLKGMLRGKPRHYLGHNPAAAWMVIALILALLLVSASGYLALPSKAASTSARVFSLVTPALADEDREDDHRRGGNSGSEFWEDIHEALAGLLLTLIGQHILGALASSLLHQENLVKSMITGRKIKRE